VPTRLARHGIALAPLPDSRFRFDLARAAHALSEEPLVDGCPCPACTRHTRAYLHYLVRARELTGVRLLCLHNLAYLERLVSGAREAIAAGHYRAYRTAVLEGAAPWAAASVAY
jgi:queuine tRNA-ribosyltransferase